MAAEIKTKLVADIKDFTTKMSLAESKAKSTSNSISSSFKGVGAAMSTVAIGVVGVTAAYQGLQAAANASVSSIDAMTAQLTNTTSQLGINMDEFVGKLQAASKGMVDNITLVTESNRALLRGLTESQVIDLMEAATTRAEQLGMSVTEAYGRMTSGVAKRERELLDELVTIEHLDVSYAKYAHSIGKTAEALSEQEKSQAIVNDIMRKTRMFANEGSIAFEDLRKAAIASKNVWDEIKADGFDWLDKMAGLVYKAAGAWETLLGKLKKFQGEAWEGGFMPKGDAFTPVDMGEKAAVVEEDGTITENKALKQKNLQQMKEEASFNKELAKKRQEWADELALVDTRNYERDIAELQVKLEKELAMYGKTAADKEAINNVYAEKMAMIREKQAEAEAREEERRLAISEREAEELEKKSEKINEFLESQRQLKLSDQERELEELYNHYEAIWELMDINDERRLESVKLYQERKAEIEAEYREQEVQQTMSLGNALVGAQLTMDQASVNSAESRFGIISGLANAAMKVGGEVGEKAFRLNQGIEIANTVVNTGSAIMKAWAQLGAFGGPMAALIAATGAAQIAAIASASPSGSSSTTTSTSTAVVSTNFNELDGITATDTTSEEEKSSTMTINIMGDILDEDYVDLLAEKISDAVDERNVILKASTARSTSK